MQSIECPAKINLYLKVRGKRPDGYHALETLFCEIDLTDRLSFEPGPGPLELAVIGADLGDPRENLVMRAAELVTKETGRAIGGRFTLEKRIPAGGGLGGGSSDAAGALRLLNAHLDSAVPRARLAALALALGSDVPFFLVGGCCVGEGRGERLTQTALPDIPRTGLLIMPGIHIATGSVFRARAERDTPEDAPRQPRIGENDLTDAARSVSPHFATIYDDLAACFDDPTRFFMTGSGSSLVYLTASPDAAVLRLEDRRPGLDVHPIRLREKPTLRAP